MSDNKENEDKKTSSWQPAVMIFLRMSAWIGFPVLVAVLIGAWFDNRYGTSPWGTLSIIGLSFIVSMVGLVKQASSEYKKIDENQEKNKKGN